MLATFEQTTVDEFRGLVTLPDFRDVSALWSPGPCENTGFFPGGFSSRPGASLYFNLTAGEIEHGETFRLSSTGQVYFLWLMDSPPVIYWSLEGGRNSLFTPHASTTRFRQVPYGNRAYIFASTAQEGLQEPRIWDITNLDPLTVAGSSVGAMAGAAGAAGSVTVGVHRLWVIYETRSGFRINSRTGGPSNDGKISFTAAGAQQIDLTGIPVHSDASITRRHIAMTAASLEEGYIALTIENNTATTASVNIADATLIANTRVDNYSQHQQPASNGMAGVIYNERLVMVDGTSRVRVSEPTLPHTFRSDLGYIDVGVNDGEAVRNCFVSEGTLYLVKYTRIYYTQDNGSDPVDWPVREFVQGIGTKSSTGIDAKNDENLVAILADKGLFAFVGGTMIELSKNIFPTWDTIRFHHNAKVVIDSYRKRIFCHVPNAAGVFVTLVCDYREKLSEDSVKWSEWISAAGPVWRGFLMDLSITQTGRVILYSASQYVRYFDSTAIGDYYFPNTVAMTWKYHFGKFGGKVGMTLFEEIEMKCNGGGNLVIEVFGPDGVSLATLSSIALSATPGQNYSKLMNVVKENMYLELRQTAPTAVFTMNHLTVFHKADGTR